MASQCSIYSASADDNSILVLRKPSPPITTGKFRNELGSTVELFEANFDLGWQPLGKIGRDS